MSLVLTVVGLPGSGKSTIAKAIAAARGFPILSTGEQLRHLAGCDPTLAAALAHGELGPEDVVQRMVDKFLQENPIAVLDGYPRHRAQAELLRRSRARLCVVHLSLRHELALARVMQRPHRGDDSEHAIRTRIARDGQALLEVLRVLTDSLVEYDATHPIEVLVSEILTRLATEASTY